MTEFKEKYINPFTDYGFKRLFGEEPSKNLLLDFLDGLLMKEQGKLKDLTYLKIERAEIAKFSPEEVQEYEDSLKTYRDLKNSIHPKAPALPISER